MHHYSSMSRKELCEHIDRLQSIADRAIETAKIATEGSKKLGHCAMALKYIIDNVKDGDALIAWAMEGAGVPLDGADNLN
jgi:hypothetical protein